MASPGITFAKLAGIRKAVTNLLNDEFSRKGQRPKGAYEGWETDDYFKRGAGLLADLKATLPELYGDFPALPGTPDNQYGEGWYSRGQLEKLTRELDNLFEVRANSEIERSGETAAAPKHTVFISHGRASDWREVQAYVEKDVGLRTLELEQQPSGGKTVGTKLESVAGSCDSAVIVMTGDDHDNEGNLRARENVIHEIGYFHGKLGASRVCLLHEEGVSIPSNLSGIVYVPFTRDMIRATFSVLRRELDAIYGRR